MSWFIKCSTCCYYSALLTLSTSFFFSLKLMLCIHLVKNKQKWNWRIFAVFLQEQRGQLISCGVHPDWTTDLLSVDGRQNSGWESSGCCERLLQNNSNSKSYNIWESMRVSQFFLTLNKSVISSTIVVNVGLEVWGEEAKHWPCLYRHPHSS